MKFVVRMLLIVSLTIVSLPALIGCLHATQTESTSQGAWFCDVGRPLKYASTDHRITREGVIRHNARGCEICPQHPAWKDSCVGQYAPMAPVP